jgi:hypothetical protein
MTWRWAIHSHQDTDSFVAKGGGWRWVLRRASQGFLIGYVAVAVFRGRTYEHHDNASQGVEYVSPEGLTMPLRSAFPEWFLSMHRWAAVLIIPLCVAQTEIVGLMDDRKEGDVSSRKRARDAHAVVGYSLLGCVGLMAVGGVMLRDSSQFSHFPLFVGAVVSPWIGMLSILPLSAFKNLPLVHASAGSVMFKSCIAVPLARVLGVALQSYLGDAERGYYYGILGSTVVTTVWTLI